MGISLRSSRHSNPLHHHSYQETVSYSIYVKHKRYQCACVLVTWQTLCLSYHYALLLLAQVGNNNGNMPANKDPELCGSADGVNLPCSHQLLLTPLSPLDGGVLLTMLLTADLQEVPYLAPPAFQLFTLVAYGMTAKLWKNWTNNKLWLHSSRVLLDSLNSTQHFTFGCCGFRSRLSDTANLPPESLLIAPKPKSVGIGALLSVQLRVSIPTVPPTRSPGGIRCALLSVPPDSPSHRPPTLYLYLVDTDMYCRESRYKRHFVVPLLSPYLR